MATTTTVAINESGRIVTSVSISLSKPSKGRQSNKLSLTKKDEKIQYSREFLLSLRHAKAANQKPNMKVEGYCFIFRKLSSYFSVIKILYT